MKRPALTWSAILAVAALAAGVVLVIPSGYLEWATATSGLSEIVPAAAPPLGMRFRLLLALFVALVLAAVLLTLADHKAQDEDAPPRRRPSSGTSPERRTIPMASAFARLANFARGRSRGAEIEEMPRPLVRRGDAHPDAPPRPPLTARDLAPPPREVVAADPQEADAMPATPQPMPWDEIKAEMERLRAQSAPLAEGTTGAGDSTARPALPMPDADMPSRPMAGAPAPLEGLSIAELADRLESRIAARSANRGAQPRMTGDAASPDTLLPQQATTPPPYEGAGSDDAQAVESALATLRNMMARTA